MERIPLNKATLHRETRQLDGYREFLPALELKRRQLLAEQARARRVLAALAEDLEALDAGVAEALPMLAAADFPLDRLVWLEALDEGEENLVGTRLPVLRGVLVAVHPYSALTRPHWVDRLVRFLSAALEVRCRMQMAQRRLVLLDAAVRTITQRVNLFDKVLIPRSRERIRRIRIHLADVERVGVVQAKLAKVKRGAPA